MLKRAMISVASLTIPVVLAACAATGPTSGAKPYPLNTCIVTENELGSMGDPVSINHEGQQVKFCCKPCVKKFQADPQKYLSKLGS